MITGTYKDWPHQRRLSVGSMMWFRPVVLIFVVGVCVALGQESQVFDVTTIFDIGDQHGNLTTNVPGSLHSRTNALGLPLYNGIDLHDPFVEPNITCDSIEKVCNWKVGDWLLIPSYLPAYSSDAPKNSFIDFKKSIKIVFWMVKDYEEFNVDLYLTSEETLDGYEGYHDVKISHAFGKYSIKHRFCSFDIGHGPVIRSSGGIVYRDTPSPGYYYEQSWCEDYDEHFSSRWIFELRLENGKLSLYDDLTKVKEWNEPYQIKYLYVGDGHNKVKKLVLNTGLGLSYVSNKEGSEMVSPVISMEEGKLCLALVFHVPTQSERSVFDIFSEDLAAERHLLYSVKNVKVGWNIKHFNVNFPSKTSVPIKLVLKKVTAAEIKLSRISRCSPDGNEVETISPFDLDLSYLPRHPNKITRFSATAYAIEPAELLDQNGRTVCVNGGVWTTAGCACPPGFFGSTCRSGCGRNRYGQDCGGLCSLRRKECRGLLMCTHSTGCHCAPGYQGGNCSESCPGGYYGNNCMQRCGHCADSSACDIYNGQCSSCKFGYLPPYCNKESVYYPSPPQLSSLEYGVIEVSFNPATYKANLSSPVLYQIQCREKGHEWKVYVSKRYPDCIDIITESLEGLKNGVLYQVRVLLMDADFNKYDGDLVGTSEILVKCDIPEHSNYAVTYESDYSSLNFSWTCCVSRSRATFRSTATSAYTNPQQRLCVTVSPRLKCETWRALIPGFRGKISAFEECRPFWHRQPPRVLTTPTSLVLTRLDMYLYSNTSTLWCPVERYEVSWKEDWQWLTQYTDGNEFSITNLLPSSSVQFKVRAKTSGGFSPYSEIVKASTQLTGLSSVRSLIAESRKSSSAELSWEPPMGSDSKVLRYTVSYKCVDRPACSPGCQTASEGQQSVQDTRITLSSLLPFTQYKVTVTPEDGQAVSIYIGTADVVPTEVPTLSVQRPVRTNTSVTVFWDEVPVCSGFLLGYNYQLTKESESLKVLESGFTRNTTATFHNLTASTPYVVKVFVTTIAGWNPDSFLAISISTSATVPEMVRNVTVYKRGRGMLGLRWAEPRVIYGPLKSFTVTHSLGQDVTSHTLEPSHCVVWPDLYCHTIEGLRSNRRYNVTVSARNSEVPEDGEVAFVTAVTKESPPSAPANLKITNISSKSIELEWNYPEMANGIVRSFLIGVEETEKYDQDSCCQIYPFVETSVKEELKIYTAEVSGLHPASTYYVSVSAKTIGLGPSQSLAVSTRPPHLPLTSLPRVQVPEISWLPQKTLPEVNNYEVYTTLVRAHLLLAVLNESQPIKVAPASGITDPKLDSLLQQEIGSPFYFIAEYNHDDEVQVSGPLEDTDSPWGRPPASLAPVVRYQLVATQILEYNGVYNVDLRYSQPFILA